MSPYRIHLWDAYSGKVKKKLDYQKESMALKRAIEHSQKPGVKEVAVTCVHSEGRRIAVARKGVLEHC